MVERGIPRGPLHLLERGIPHGHQVPIEKSNIQSLLASLFSLAILKHDFLGLFLKDDFSGLYFQVEP